MVLWPSSIRCETVDSICKDKTYSEKTGTLDESSSRRGAETGQRGEKGGTGRGTAAVFLQNREKMRRGLDKGVWPDVYLQHDSQQGAARRKVIDSGKSPLSSRLQKGINSFQHFIDDLSTLCRQHRLSAGRFPSAHPTLRQSARSDISPSPGGVSDTAAIRRPRAGVPGTSSAGSASDNRSGEFRPGTNPPKNPIVW